MATATKTHKEKIQDWVEQNPLRRWRKSEGLAMMDVASGTGMAFSSIQQHEQGGYYPSEDSMAKLAKAMGVTYEKLDADWTRWYNRRPKLG